MATVARLNVPFVPQNEAFYCVPACMSMCIRYLNTEVLTTPIPDFSLSEIAKIVHTQDGTWAPDVKNMNEHLEEGAPSVEFEDEYMVRTLPEIVTEFTAGRPCIPLLKLTDGMKHTWHAIVVTGISIETNQIWYNDPIYSDARFGVRSSKLSAFDALWRAALTTLVKVQIGQKTRTVLTQFIKPEEKVEVKKDES